MTIQHLNREQIRQLKQAMLTEQSDTVSYGELLHADQLISDAEVTLRFYGTEFTKDDFF